MSEADTIMPFGKHRGEPIHSIERSYLEFLLEQDWFEKKFPELCKDVEAHLTRRDRSGDTY